VQPAKRRPLEFTAQRPCNGAPERGFAHAGRAREAEDRPLGLRIELAHAQEFKDAVLDFVEAAVIFIKNFFGMDNIQPVARKLFPRQFHQPVKVGAHHVGLGRIGVHARKAAQLLVGFLAHVLGQACFFKGLLEVFKVFLAVFVLVAKFGADSLELLPQKVILLRLVHALAGRALDARLHGGDFNLALQLGVDQHEAVNGILRLENALGIGCFHAHVGGDKVGQAARIVHALQDGKNVWRGKATQGQHLFALLAHGAQQGLHRGVYHRDLLGQGFNARFKEGFHLAVARNPCAAHALHKNFHPRIGHLEHAHDLHYGADLVEVFRLGIFGGFFFLRAHKQVPPVFQGCVHGLYGFVASDEQRQDHIVEDNHVSNGQHGQRVGNALRRRIETALVIQRLGRVHFRIVRFAVDGRFCLNGFFLIQQNVFFIDVSHIYSPRLLSIQMRCDCVML